MAERIDTGVSREVALRALLDGPATTHWVAKRCRLMTRQAYRLLRSMEVDGLVRRDEKMRGLWHRQPKSQQPRRHT